MTDIIKKRKMAAEKMYLRQRNYRRVRDRALARLAQMYPDDYRRLFEQEKERDEAKSNHWTAITGRPSAGDYVSDDIRSTKGNPAPDMGEEAGDNGGEE